MVCPQVIDLEHRGGEAAEAEVKIHVNYARIGEGEKGEWELDGSKDYHTMPGR